MKSRHELSQFYKTKQNHGRQEPLPWNIDTALNLFREPSIGGKKEWESEREKEEKRSEKWNSQDKNRGYIGWALMTLYYNDNGKPSRQGTGKGFRRQPGTWSPLTGRTSLSLVKASGVISSL